VPPPAPTLSVGNISVIERHLGLHNANFTLTLSAASANPVTVHFATANGTAKSPSDYRARSGDLTFAPGQTSLNVSVQVVGDRAPEANETFQLVLSNPSNATLGSSTATGTIVNDDRYSAKATLSRDQNWGTGYRGYIKIANNSASTIKPWTLEFDLAADITDIWDAQIISHVGNHYTIIADGNASIKAHKSITFGFVAEGPSTHLPVHYRLNSVPL
jgi:hypothetical protein